MADKFYFFTDLDLIQPQLQSQAFGRVLNGHPDFLASLDRWRVSSMHSASADPLAYAICDGDVIVQEDSSSSGTLINLILKPTIQPSKIGISLPEVKYFVYRGIKKSSLINGTTVIMPATNTLSKIINDDNDTATTTVAAPQRCLGIERDSSPYFDGTDSLDNLFYVPSNTTSDPNGVFQRYPVSGGASLGTFDKNSFGIEIILNSVHFREPLSEFRGHRHHIEIGLLSSNTGTHWEMTHRMEKERILNYLDIAAFYGSFQGIAKVYARKSTDAVDSNFKYDFDDINKDDIYKELLERDSGVLDHLFFNRNTVYVDIRNELGYSYNQMKNNNNVFYLLANSDFNVWINSFNGASRNYYDDGSGLLWPLYALKPEALTHSVFPESGDSSTIRIAMDPGDNWDPIFYVSYGKSSRIKEDDIRIGDSNFYVGKQSINTDAFQYGVAVEVPAVNLNSTNYSVAGYIRIMFFKRIDYYYFESEKFALRQQSYLDHLFPLIDLKNLYQTTGNISMYIYDNDVYVDFASTKEEKGKDFVGKLGIARDASNTTLFVLGKERRYKGNHEVKNGLLGLTSDSLTQFGHFLNYIDEKETKAELDRTALTIGTVSSQITRFIPNRRRRLNQDLDKVFLCIIIPNAKYDSLATVAGTAGIDLNLPVYLCIGDGTSTNLNTSFTKTDDNGAEYLSLPLHIRGYEDFGGVLEVLQTVTDGSSADPQTTIYGHKL